MYKDKLLRLDVIFNAYRTSRREKGYAAYSLILRIKQLCSAPDMGVLLILMLIDDKSWS